MTNSADPDQLASSEANWSGSTQFAKTRQQEKGYNFSGCMMSIILNPCPAEPGYTLLLQTV